MVWLGFELGIAPALGLSQAKRVRPVDRLALAADHVLYGLVLSATRPTEGYPGLSAPRDWREVRAGSTLVP